MSARVATRVIAKLDAASVSAGVRAPEVRVTALVAIYRALGAISIWA